MVASPILPRLWQGADPTQDTIAAIRPDVLVLCAWECQHHMRDFGRVHVIRAPMDDCAEVPIQTAKNAAAAVIRAYRQGKRILVCCHQGLNRSGLVVALALRVLLRVSGRRATIHVQLQREGALFNNAFVDWLATLPAPK